jgi:hypothetical protein
VLVVPWVAVAMTTTSRGHYVYLLEVAALGLLALFLWRRSPAFLRSRWVRAADVVLWNAVLAFLLAEILVRIFLASGQAPAWLESTPDTVRYRLDPRIEWLGTLPNSLGFYDEEFTEEKRPGVVRIAVLGDSYTVGLVPYAENYITIADVAMGSKVELLNFGVSHMAVRQYLEILISDGLRFKPDLVLLSLYMGNDIRPDPPRGLLSYTGSRSLSAIRILWIVLTEGSPYRSALRLNDQGVLRYLPDGTPIELPMMSEEKYLAREWKHLRRVFRPPQSRRMKRAWRDTDRAMEELMALCREQDIPVVATLAPDEIQVAPALLAEVTTHYGADPSDFDLDYPRRRLKARLEQLGVSVLDLTDPLRQAERGGPTYRLRAVHWNQRGNEAAARALVPWLRQQVEHLVQTD